jgi:Domain of unknown function (DUF4340)
VTWRRALFYVAVWAALAAYAFATRPGPPPAPAPAAQLPAPTDALAHGMRSSEVAEIEIQTPSAQVVLARTGDRWTVRQPVGALVQGGLVDALLASLLETPEVGSIDSDRAAEFGLNDPHLRIRLRRAGGNPLVIDIGARNPTGTAVYARVEGSPHLALIGLNAQYYADLLIQATRNAGG